LAAYIAVAKKTGSKCYFIKPDRTAMNWVGQFFERPKSLPRSGTDRWDSTRLTRFEQICGIAIYRESLRPMLAMAKVALRHRRLFAHYAKTMAGIYPRIA
jgi:hypothetical protein